MENFEMIRLKWLDEKRDSNKKDHIIAALEEKNRSLSVIQFNQICNLKNLTFASFISIELSS